MLFVITVYSLFKNWRTEIRDICFNTKFFIYVGEIECCVKKLNSLWIKSPENTINKREKNIVMVTDFFPLGLVI